MLALLGTQHRFLLPKGLLGKNLCDGEVVWKTRKGRLQSTRGHCICSNSKAVAAGLRGETTGSLGAPLQDACQHGSNNLAAIDTAIAGENALIDLTQSLSLCSWS